MEKVKKLVVNYWLTISNWVRKNPVEFGLLVVIIAVASFLRFYKISGYMTFLGDEGRDAIIVRRLLVNKDPILIGPGTSIGNMYLGPLYYYLIAPSLWLFKFSPVGPSAFVAFLGVITVIFVYLVGKEWFSPKAGLIAAALYAISPVVITYSRSSWNPNVMPFFSLLCIYSIWKVWKKRKFVWLIVSAISLAFALQSHYLGLLLIPVMAFFWALTFFAASARGEDIDEKAQITLFLKNTFISVFLFLFLMSPLAIFDARHGLINFNAMKKFFLERQTTVSAKPWNAIPKVPELLTAITARLITAREIKFGEIILAVVSIPSILLTLGRKRLHKNEASGFTVLFVWLLVALIGLGIYKQEIYDHYYGFFFAAPFLFLGGFIDGISENLSKFGKGLLGVGLLAIIGVNIYNSPLKGPPNMQLQRAQEVSQKIEEESKGKPFNLAVLAERNYEDGYQYFLEKDGYPVVDIDAQTPESITDQLFAVCELPHEKCDPTHSPKAEVANFGWSKVINQWEVYGVQLYKLIHTQ
ncbi:ArnT family glycosyltransferase [Patescibacteria group bacterium]